MFGLGFWEIVAIAIVGVLVFGKRLPEVGRSLGKGVVEFKKGLAGIEDDVDKAVDRERQAQSQHRLAAQDQNQAQATTQAPPQTQARSEQTSANPSDHPSI